MEKKRKSGREKVEGEDVISIGYMRQEQRKRGRVPSSRPDKAESAFSAGAGKAVELRPRRLEALQIDNS